MSDKERISFIEKISELDDVASEAGGFVLNSESESRPHYNYRAISNYCKEKGIEPLDMTLRELNSFIVQ